MVNSELRPIDTHNCCVFRYNASPSKWKTYGFVIAIIVGIGGLVTGGAGVLSYFQVGALSHLPQINAIAMMAAGFGGGVFFLITGSIGTLRNRQIMQRTDKKSNDQDNSMGTQNVRQTEFIDSTSKGVIKGDERFGKELWETYIGDVGNEPKLPENIDIILNSRCPFSGDESVKVKDTHMLVLIPASVNGEPFTLNKLQELIQNPKQGHKTGFRSYDGSFLKADYGGIQVNKSYWVLMTKDVVPRSRNRGKNYEEDKDYEKRKKIINQYADQDYVLPQSHEAAVCIFMEFILSGTYLFSHNPETYMVCSEKFGSFESAVLGDFTSNGLRVQTDNFVDTRNFCFAALRRFAIG